MELKPTGMEAAIYYYLNKFGCFILFAIQSRFSALCSLLSALCSLFLTTLIIEKSIQNNWD